MVSQCFADIAAGALPSAVSAILAWLQPDPVPTALCAFQVRARGVENRTAAWDFMRSA